MVKGRKNLSNQPINYNNELPDMMYYFISGGLPDNYGGLTKSLLLRSKLFGEESQKEYHLSYF